MTQPLMIEAEIYFGRQEKGTRILKRGAAPEIPQGRLPRITRLMALAIHFEELIAAGEILDYTELAELGQVTKARISQIMNLLLLAPEIQEAILFLPRVQGGRDPLTVRELQPIALTADWARQREMWEELCLRSQKVDD